MVTSVSRPKYFSNVFTKCYMKENTWIQSTGFVPICIYSLYSVYIYHFYIYSSYVLRQLHCSNKIAFASVKIVGVSQHERFGEYIQYIGKIVCKVAFMFFLIMNLEFRFQCVGSYLHWKFFLSGFVLFFCIILISNIAFAWWAKWHTARLKQCLRLMKNK